MSYKVSVTKDATNDIDEIIEYIAIQLKNPVAANHLLSEIEKSFITISELPTAFPLCNDKRLFESGYRKIPVKNYIIFYRVDAENKIIYILRVIYGRRDYWNLL